ncbi:hypothetical protein ACWZEH_04775 [Streptomyces sp. QTS137]
MSGSRAQRTAARRSARRGMARRGTTVAAASVVVAAGTAAGMISALGEGRGSDGARPASVR